MTEDELKRWTETIAQILAFCRNRKLSTPDLIASQFAAELSNYTDTSDFLARYKSYCV